MGCVSSTCRKLCGYIEDHDCKKEPDWSYFWNGATKELYELENYYSKYSTDGGHTAKFLEPGSTAILSQEKVDAISGFLHDDPSNDDVGCCLRPIAQKKSNMEKFRLQQV